MELERKAKEIKRWPVKSGASHHQELAKDLRIEEKGQLICFVVFSLQALTTKTLILFLLGKADLLADQIKNNFKKSSTQEEKILILVNQLFDEMGFHGSTLDYHHRSNSYMNEVMDDREGLPITLSVLLIELANRLDLPILGLGL